MPLRLAETHRTGIGARHLAAASIVVVIALVAADRFVFMPRSSEPASAPRPQLAAVAAAVAPPANAQPVVTNLVAADGSAVAPERLRGRWTILFSPSDPCKDACARMMETLAAVARDPASGIQDGAAQILLTRRSIPDAEKDFVVLDPEGRSAGILSHTTDAGRVVSGLATLRAAFASSAPSIASR